MPFYSLLRQAEVPSRLRLMRAQLNSDLDLSTLATLDKVVFASLFELKRMSGPSCRSYPPATDLAASRPPGALCKALIQKGE